MIKQETLEFIEKHKYKEIIFCFYIINNKIQFCLYSFKSNDRNVFQTKDATDNFIFEIDGEYILYYNFVESVTIDKNEYEELIRSYKICERIMNISKMEEVFEILKKEYVYAKRK